MLVFSLIILQVLIFGGLFFLIRYLLTRNFTDATSHMQGMIKGYENKGEEVKKKFEEADKHYQDAIKKADNEIAELKDQLKKEVDTEKKSVLDLAHKESDALINKARSTCDSMEKEMDLLVDRKALERAREMLPQIFTKDLCKMIHEVWADSLIENGFTPMEWLKVPEDIKQAKVVSAFALTKGQKELLIKKLNSKIDRKVTLEEKVNDSLVAGIVITVGNLVFDGSLTSKIREIVRESYVDES